MRLSETPGQGEGCAMRAMASVFITNIEINKIRNVKNIEIPLADGEMKHLIVTGKNGSGKTSLIEAHLHVELQKKVLPFLTKMFPKIQFIVSTHSPFVITSEPNAVIYDLEKRIRAENLTAYSYEGIVEYYYGLNLYSDDIKARFERYKELIGKDKRTVDENAQLAEIIS
jgi:predicted ATP-binding protein involved in virulence